MTKEELIKKLEELQKDTDLERSHGEADDLLLEYINDNDIREAYDKLDKWYA